ncbi:FadR/GntR family transcriptional regulator [Natranaerofaba carboxydovora]|uniref:FadR/GntR family transcriptional regulator n=1 Tax=Natranaerofaba carboxydovora TaxID=2742683 RepID=UPI001F136ECF|nr:FadR/GntR family transcriptional regulator [Natranaerofaba carboxydovora]UMZ74105.1 HTH-type transcriptional regulator LutR [Natranaerofaba carboxydovora]
MFRPIKHKRVYEEILDQIRELITEGSLKPGDKLMSERAMSEKLQVSRASVREAFSVLSMLGILEGKPGEGTFIKKVPEDSFIKPFAMMLMLDRDSNMEVLETRLTLEVECSALACVRGTDEDIEKIYTYLQKMEEDISEGNLGEYHDGMFHYSIWEATNNNILLRLMNTIYDMIIETMKHSRVKMFEKPGNKKILLEQHKKIYQAIKEKDVEKAREAMREHLLFVNKENQGYFEEK